MKCDTRKKDREQCTRDIKSLSLLEAVLVGQTHQLALRDHCAHREQLMAALFS